MKTDLAHWLALWQRLGAQGDGAAWHEKLTAAYSESGRHYHNLRHLDECLTALDEARAAEDVPNRDAVEAALWFHDAVYDPKAADNEGKSADLAHQALSAAGLAREFVAHATRLVMSTKKHETNGHADAQWMIDIDLSILGREQKRFDEYEAQIRAEYA